MLLWLIIQPKAVQPLGPRRLTIWSNSNSSKLDLARLKEEEPERYREVLGELRRLQRHVGSALVDVYDLSGNQERIQRGGE